LWKLPEVSVQMNLMDWLLWKDSTDESLEKDRPY
jgi:hypothetical protein